MTKLNEMLMFSLLRNIEEIKGKNTYLVQLNSLEVLRVCGRDLDIFSPISICLSAKTLRLLFRRWHLILMQVTFISFISISPSAGTFSN